MQQRNANRIFIVKLLGKVIGMKYIGLTRLIELPVVGGIGKAQSLDRKSVV